MGILNTGEKSMGMLLGVIILDINCLRISYQSIPRTRRRVRARGWIRSNRVKAEKRGSTGTGTHWYTPYYKHSTSQESKHHYKQTYSSTMGDGDYLGRQYSPDADSLKSSAGMYQLPTEKGDYSYAVANRLLRARLPCEVLKAKRRKPQRHKETLQSFLDSARHRTQPNPTAK